MHPMPLIRFNPIRILISIEMVWESCTMQFICFFGVLFLSYKPLWNVLQSFENSLRGVNCMVLASVTTQFRFCFVLFCVLSISCNLLNCVGKSSEMGCNLWILLQISWNVWLQAFCRFSRVVGALGNPRELGNFRQLVVRSRASSMVARSSAGRVLSIQSHTVHVRLQQLPCFLVFI